MTSTRKIRMRIVAKHAKHGYSFSKVHETWKRMKVRCLDPENDRFPRYGARGIGVHREWAEHFLSFLRDVGEPPTPEHSLDRIDGTKGYFPGNVRWATWAEQCRNRCVTVMATVFGVTKPLADWTDDPNCPVDHRVAWRRIRDGWDPAIAIYLPPHRELT